MGENYPGSGYGLSERDVELARQISAVARELGVPADPSASGCRTTRPRRASRRRSPPAATW
jgi:hypothetical protein